MPKRTYVYIKPESSPLSNNLEVLIRNDKKKLPGEWLELARTEAILMQDFVIMPIHMALACLKEGLVVTSNQVSINYQDYLAALLKITGQGDGSLTSHLEPSPLLREMLTNRLSKDTLVGEIGSENLFRTCVLQDDGLAFRAFCTISSGEIN